MRIQGYDSYNNCSYLNNNKYNNFNGYATKKVQKVFINLQNDGAETGGHTAEGLYNKLSDFLSKLNPNIKFDYQNHSIFKKRSGFFFENTENRKRIYATAREDCLGHVPIRDKNSLFIKDPHVYPDERVSYHTYHNELIDDWQEYYTGYDRYSDGHGSIYVKRSSILGGILTVTKTIFSLIPIRESHPYYNFHFENMTKYVNELTTKYTPDEINKLLQ